MGNLREVGVPVAQPGKQLGKKLLGLLALLSIAKDVQGRAGVHRRLHYARGAMIRRRKVEQPLHNLAIGLADNA